MQIYNTMTRKKEALIPLKPGEISMYVCGLRCIIISTSAMPGPSWCSIPCAGIWSIGATR